MVNPTLLFAPNVSNNPTIKFSKKTIDGVLFVCFNRQWKSRLHLRRPDRAEMDRPAGK